MPSMSSPGGRPRDASLDGAILDAAVEHLATNGYEAMSLVAVAKAAGTTRQALYRRWPTKADLATAAIAQLSGADTPAATDDPFLDLVAELAAFQRGVTRPNGVSMVGSMLQSATDRELRDLYRQRIVSPRRQRIRGILRRGRDGGLLAADADLDYATSFATGSFYALELAGITVPRTWPRRTARLIWRSCGGEPSA